ncbi:MAG: MerC domain-containing protein, partial [Bacteroidota bacterium]
LGIFSALLCLIHCLVGPLLLGAVAHAHNHGHADHFWLDHRWDYVFLAIGFLAVWFSSRHTHSKLLKWALWGTYGLLATAIVFETQHEVLRYLVYVASFGLIGAHLFNLRSHFFPSFAKASH